jgi:hypothetical protein
MANIHILHADFVNSWQQLQQRWHQTIDMWDDSVRYQFERDFWQPLETEVRATQRELIRLDDVITSIMHNKRY